MVGRQIAREQFYGREVALMRLGEEGSSSKEPLDISILCVGYPLRVPADAYPF